MMTIDQQVRFIRILWNEAQRLGTLERSSQLHMKDLLQYFDVRLVCALDTVLEAPPVIEIESDAALPENECVTHSATTS